MNGIAEGVRQLHGTSVNQVRDVEHVLVTVGTGLPTSGLILRSVTVSETSTNNASYFGLKNRWWSW